MLQSLPLSVSAEVRFFFLKKMFISASVDTGLSIWINEVIYNMCNIFPLHWCLLAQRSGDGSG